jgi:hypothetical protein
VINEIIRLLDFYRSFNLWSNKRKKQTSTIYEAFWQHHVFAFYIDEWIYKKKSFDQRKEEASLALSTVYNASLLLRTIQDS